MIAAVPARLPTRRIGKDSEARALLLDHAETLMREQGYAALTSRQLAKLAGLSPQIVYYYFHTMDDLFEAMFARVADFYLTAIDGIGPKNQPLLRLWELSSDPSRAVLVSEFIALANHRKSLQAMIADFGRNFQQRQADIIARCFAEQGVSLSVWPPAIVAQIIESLARAFSFSPGIGMAEEYVAAREFVARRLSTLFDN